MRLYKCPVICLDDNEVYYIFNKNYMTSKWCQALLIYDKDDKYIGIFSKNRFMLLGDWRDARINEILE